MGEQRRLFMGNWQLDPYHTQVEFSARHRTMMTLRGYFDELSAIADIDPEHPETASVEVTISTASIRTNNGIRDNDLRSSNFLEVEKYREFNDPGMMGHRIAYGATTQINRKDFGLSFSMMLDGRIVVSEEIQITIEGELVEQKQAAETAS